MKANASKNPLTSPWSKFKTKPAAPTSKPAEEAQPAQKKGGIFGGLFNKNKTAEVKPPAFDISVVETKKNSLLSESTESSSGKLSAAPINELDVEVKSVSELVKEIEAPKPVVPRNEPITSKLDKVAISSIVQNYNQAIGNTPTKPAAPIIATVPVVEDQENIQPVAAPAPIKAAEVSPVKMVISTPSKQAPEQNVLREISNDALASKALYTPVQAPQPPVEEEEEEEPSDEYQIEDR